MKIKIQCKQCEKKLVATEKLFGRRVKCPDCGTAINVPKPAAPASLDDEDDELPALPKKRRRTAESTTPLPPKSGRAKSPAPSTATSAGADCGGCGKTLAEGIRYCVSCGYHNYDAAEESVKIANTVTSRLDRLYGMISFNRWMRVLRRFF